MLDSVFFFPEETNSCFPPIYYFFANMSLKLSCIKVKFTKLETNLKLIADSMVILLTLVMKLPFFYIFIHSFYHCLKNVDNLQRRYVDRKMLLQNSHQGTIFESSFI